MANYGIKICTSLSAAELRREAGYEKRRRPALRMMAIANALDGYDRHEAARLAGMSDQALRDAIKRYNASGLAGLSAEDGASAKARPGSRGRAVAGDPGGPRSRDGGSLGLHAR